MDEKKADDNTFKAKIYKKNSPDKEPRLFESDDKLLKNLCKHPKEIFNIDKIVSEYGEDVETIYFKLKYHKGKVTVKLDTYDYNRNYNKQSIEKNFNR